MSEAIPDEPTRAPRQRSWYNNLPLVAGLVLVLLGLGNWVTGTLRTSVYEAKLENAVSAPSRGGVSGERLSAEEVEIARVRMDFYHVVASGGRFMTAAGFLLATFGIARALRPQAEK